MIRILKNRLALSTVVTTLIILVVSILLASVLTVFATNVVSTRVQEENLYVSKQHIWVADDGTTQGAIMVTNNGGRDVVINKIAVRGQECTNLTVATTTDVGTDITYSDASAGAGGDSVPITLAAGTSVTVYITSPDSVSTNDIGLTVAFSVFTAQAMYYKETNVQAAPAA